MQANEAEILNAINSIFKPGDVVEVRVPKTKQFGTVSGYFSNFEEMAKKIVELSGQHAGVYYTLNPVVPALLARTDNKLERKASTTTSDPDIARRSWLLIDADPVRPAGISSTDAEKAAALDTLKQVYSYLKELGWPAPISADSGNGYHLLYKLDLPNTKENTDLVKSVLKALGDRFDTDAVKIDKSVFNAARIVKAYGSLACKGVSTVDRPHRLSKLRTTTGGKEAVSVEQLQELTSVAPKSILLPAQSYSGSGSGKVITTDRIEEFLAYYEIAFKEMKRESNGYKWVLEECPFNPEHNQGEVAVFLNDDGGPGFRCMHNSCAENGWKQFRPHLEQTFNKKFYFFNNKPSALPANAKSISKLHLVSAADAVPEKITWLWKDRIPMGKLTLLAGHPGVGKGCATIDIIARATTGAAWFDAENKQPPMQALLISSEDGAGDTLIPRLIAAEADRSKVKIFYHTITADGDKGFTLDTDLPALRQALEENPAVKLVVIDPISNHLGELSLNREQEVRQALMPLGKLAESYGVAIILVSHLNKSKDLEAVQRVLGAQGLIGAVRVAWLFQKSEDGDSTMIPMKANISKDEGGLEYEIVEQEINIGDESVGIARLVWKKKTFETADASMKKGQTSKHKQAIILLKDLLKDGPLTRQAVIEQFEAYDISDKIAENAFKTLNGVSVKKFGTEALWSLPEMNEKVIL